MLISSPDWRGLPQAFALQRRTGLRCSSWVWLIPTSPTFTHNLFPTCTGPLTWHEDLRSSPQRGCVERLQLEATGLRRSSTPRTRARDHLTGEVEEDHLSMRSIATLLEDSVQVLSRMIATTAASTGTARGIA